MSAGFCFYAAGLRRNTQNVGQVLIVLLFMPACVGKETLNLQESIETGVYI